MNVPYVNIGKQNELLLDDILPVVKEVIASGQYILGDYVSQFEKAFAEMHGVKHALGVANGTDALVLALKALGISAGDEVITCPNSYLASASSIVLAGGQPIFCDVDDDMNMDPSSFENAITTKTKAVIPVHLTGKPANMDAILKIANRHGIRVIEDAAQAVGASLNGKMVGGIGDLGCFSLHPLKNLSACGDGGMITTNNDELYQYLLLARNHGHSSRDTVDFFSLNSRLDALQAVILNVKIKELPRWNDRRRAIAHRYNKAFGSVVRTPKLEDNEHAVFHTYIIQTSKRDELMKFLSDNGVDTKVHYPIPIHKQKAWIDRYGDNISYPKTENQAKEILSLPVFPELTDEQVDYVIEMVTRYFKADQ